MSCESTASRGPAYTIRPTHADISLSVPQSRNDDFPLLSCACCPQHTFYRMLALCRPSTLLRPATSCRLPTLARTPQRIVIPSIYRSFSSTAMTATIHQIAQKGFGVGTNELYDRCAVLIYATYFTRRTNHLPSSSHRARPSYRPAALAHILQAVRGSPPLNIVE